MTQIVSAKIDKLHFPLNEPFAVATRTAYEASNILLQLTAENGLVGYGSSAPVEYITGETYETVVTSLTDSFDSVVGQQVNRLQPLLTLASELIPDQPAARTALEMSLFDLWGKHWNIPLWHYFGGAQQRLTTDLTVPIVTRQRASEIATAADGEGFTHLKVKVGDPNGADCDLARLQAVVDSAPKLGIRIDANQAFTADTAIEFVKRALEIAPNLELVEQPVPKEDIEGLAYVHSRIAVPLFADESAQSVESVAKLIRTNAVDGVNVKLMKSGIYGAWQIAALCRSHGVKLMIGCMLESRLSLTAACALVGGTGWFDYVDLDSHRLLRPTALFGGGMTDDGPALYSGCNEPGFGTIVSMEQWNNHSKESVN